MTKIKIFIDFEAITLPFSRELKIKNDFPYAYSLGVYKGKKFKMKTHIFNFSTNHVEDAFEDMRRSILKDIRDILDNPTFKINKDTTKFVGWSPNLEKKLISIIYPGVIVERLNEGFELSLTRLTPEFSNDYFYELRKELAKSESNNFKLIKRFDSDGALAAFVGYLLLSKATGFKGRWYLDINVRTLLKELRVYSKDDVWRMDFLNTNRPLMESRKEKALVLVKERQRISKDISKKERFYNSLLQVDKDATVEGLIGSLNNELNELKKDKEELDKKFDNI